ncbi:hypothetical protein BDZ97DRAFT_1867521, partial [Flammula alnicola]
MFFVHTYFKNKSSEPFVKVRMAIWIVILVTIPSIVLHLPCYHVSSLPRLLDIL